MTRQKTADLVEAFKIIDAANYVDVDLSKNLSEIDLKDGGDILLSFAGMKAPVIFGRGEEAEKIVYLDALWKRETDANKFINESRYIDLRFNHAVYLGLLEK